MHKHAANHIYEALSMVFNQSLLQGIFPENFKISKVTPIDNGDEEMDSFNYRPISSLSALTRIFEKLVCKLFEQAWNPIRVPIWL